MGIGTGTALLIAGALSAGGAVYASEEQRKAQSEANRRMQEAERQAEDERRRIASETKPEDEVASAAVFGVKDTANIGDTSEFIVERKTNPLLGSSGSTGLGFKI